MPSLRPVVRCLSDAGSGYGPESGFNLLTLQNEIQGVLDPIIGSVRSTIEVQWRGHLVRMYIRGVAQMTSWGLTQSGLPIVFEGPPIQDAIAYAENRGAVMVTQMEAETQRRLARVISNAIKNKRGVEGMARDIKQSMVDMGRDRSRMIARTESNDALSQAFLDRGKRLGVASSEWIPRFPLDEDCLINARAGLVKLGTPFPSGHLRPPAHPNCECALAPSMTVAK